MANFLLEAFPDSLSIRPGWGCDLNDVNHRDWPNTFSWEGLPEKLLQHRRATRLSLRVWKGDFEDYEFLQFCSILKENLPAVTRLHVVYLPEDALMAKLLECFPNLTTLELCDWEAEVTLTFKAIGGLKKLEEFVFHPESDYRTCYPITPKCFENLADSLEVLPMLKKVKIDNWQCSEPRKCWQPLVFALGGKPNLGLNITRSGFECIGDPMQFNPDDPDSCIEFVMDDDQWNILQNGPTWEQQLKEVQRRYNLILPGGQDLQSFVEDEEAEIPQDLVDTWMEVLDSLFHRHNHCFYAMMNKVEIIPQRQANRWKDQLFVLHQEPNQFGCFYAILAKYPMDKWHASPFWDTANHNELIPRKNRSPVVLEKLLQETGKNYHAMTADYHAMTADRDAWRQKFEELQGKVNALASSN